MNVSMPTAASFTLDASHKDTYIIGRDASTADLHIDSSRQPNLLSRRHAILQWTAAGGPTTLGGWRLIDLRSVNGLYVNDVKVSEALLKDGDVLCFGGGAAVKDGSRREQPNSEFRYVYRSQQREQPTTPPPATSEAPSVSASVGSAEYEASLSSSTEGRALQRSISLPFAALHRSASLDSPHLSAASPLTSPLRSPSRKRRRTTADEQQQCAEADRRRVERMDEEKREMHEQYLMALADMEKRELDRREAETKYRDEQRRQEEEIREERRRVAELERERAEKQAKEEAERRRMEEAIRKLEAEREQMDASEQEEKRRIKAELDAMRQRMDEMKEASDSERTSAERMKAITEQQRETMLQQLKEEFVCQFCISALVAPLTLACSHSFCSGCLSGWFQSGNDTCISCRQPVNLPPIRALSLDNAIGHLLSGDELAEWKQRKEQWLDEQRAEQRRHRALKEHIEQQRRTNPASLSFLDISRQWADEERKLFADGFAPYTKSEECRRAYCELVGLTEEWLQQRARVEELKRACINLRLKSDGVELPVAAAMNGNRSGLEKAALQRRLWLLLQFGCRIV